MKYIKLDNITNIQYIGNVTNLSVEKDESYITQLGIVHNCRCITIQLEKGKVSSLTGVKANEEKLFANNPGKTELIFTEEGESQHPYFNVGSKFELLKAKNFNLPLPK